MSERARDVLALLRTLLDWMPPSPVSIRRSHTGEVGSGSKPCPSCGGRGRVGKRGTLCAHCSGSGFVVIDAYTGREMTTVERTVVRKRRARCDGCGGHGVHGNGRRCFHCGGTGIRETAEERNDSELERLEGLRRIRAGLEAPDAFAEWQERKERWYRQGSYDEVDHGLTCLPERQRVILLRYVVYGVADIKTPALDELIAEAAEALAKLMPERIRVPAWARERPDEHGKGRWANGHAQGVRNTRIRQLAADGTSLTKIGRQFGLTKQAVSNVLRRSA